MDLAEHRVVPVQIGSVPESDVELALPRVGPAVDHAHHPFLIVAAVRVDLVGNAVSWGRSHIGVRDPGLNHMPRSHPMKHRAIVEGVSVREGLVLDGSLGQSHEVRHRHGSPPKSRERTISPFGVESSA